MRQATLEQAPNELADLIEAAIHGENVFIAKDGCQIVQLVPAEPRPAGTARGLLTIGDDFDEPLEDFGPIMQ